MGKGIGMDAMTAFEGLGAGNGGLGGLDMEVLLGDGSWVCNKHQNQFTRNKEGSQNNCGDSQSNCLSGMQFIFVFFYMFQVLLVRCSFRF